MKPHDERGSATVLLVGVVAVGLGLLATCLGLIAAMVASTTARAAADSGALAAAQAIARGSHEAACANADEHVRRNAASLVECTVSGEEVEVTVTVRARVPWVGMAGARARAGPAR